MNNVSFYAVALTVVLLDQLSKYYIQRAFRPGQIVPVISHFFNLTLVLNPGAAFGFLAASSANFRNPFFIAVSLLAVAFIVYHRSRYSRMGIFPSLGLSLILGGALGNLVDRFRLGMVVDFLDFYYGDYHWPAFNVADSAITVGVALMILELIAERRRR